MSEQKKEPSPQSQKLDSNCIDNRSAETIKIKQKFFQAFSKSQLQLKQPKHDTKVDFPSKKGGRMKYSYASLGSVIACLKPFFENGFAFSQHEGYKNSLGQWFLQTDVYHESGHFESHVTFLKNFPAGVEEKQFASALTYARRYALCSIFGIYGDKDTDCIMEEIYKESAPKNQNFPVPEKPISVKLQLELEERMKIDPDFKKNIISIFRDKGIDSVAGIPEKAEKFFWQKLGVVADEQ